MASNTQIPLNSFQKWMQQMLLDPFQRTELDANEFLPEDLQKMGLEGVVRSSSKIGPREHLAIYQRSYIARLRHCMSQQFSALEYALGEDLFCSFADMYLAEHPSTHYNLANLGDSFVSFLNSQRPDAESETKEDWIDFILELATFEHAVGVIFEMKADENFELANKQSSPSELSLVPTARLFKFNFPISWFYTQFKQGQTPELPHAQPGYCIVFRHNFRIAIYDLSEAVYHFLSSVKQGMTLDEASNHLGFDFSELLPPWISNKFFKVEKAL